MDKSWPSPVFDTATPMGGPAAPEPSAPTPRKRRAGRIALIVSCAVLAVGCLVLGAALLGTHTNLVSSRIAVEAGKRSLNDAHRKLEQARADAAEAYRQLEEAREAPERGGHCHALAVLVQAAHKMGDKDGMEVFLKRLTEVC